MSDRAALLRAGTDRLEAAGIEGAARDARLLMRWASGLDGAQLGAALDGFPDADELDRWGRALARRAGRTPLSHITGRREFWGRSFRVTPDVLDPRPETEVLVAEALNLGPFPRILDLGVGSGCILLTLLAEWPDAQGTGTDLSDPAIEVAKENAAALGVSERTAFHRSDWFSDVTGQFDLIVSNPPYISASEMPALSPEVREHEPQSALTPGGDGLAAYRAIGAAARAHLALGGVLMLEVGATQADPVAGILTFSGLRVRSIVPDLDQRARVVVASV